MKDYYAILGVQRDASREEIRNTYKQKAQDMHPDKGGDVEQFKHLTEAYRVLINKDKRRRYDAGEDVTIMERGVDLLAKERLAMLFHQFVVQIGQGKDLVKEMKESLWQDRTTIQQTIREQYKSIEAIENIRSRVKYNGDEQSDDVLSNVLDQIARSNKDQIKRLKKKLEIIEKTIILLGNYSFEVDQINLLTSATAGTFYRFDQV